MMMRSGGFNVPADYFRNPQRMPGGAAMMPGTPQLARRRSAMTGVLIGIGIGLTLVVGGIAYSWRANANPAPLASADPTVPVTTPAAPATDPAAAAAPAKLVVNVVIDPIDLGTVQIDGDKNDSPHKTPRVFTVAKDDHISLRAEAKGYRSKVVTLDGATIDPHDPRLVVKLEKDAPIPGTAKVGPQAPVVPGKPGPAAKPGSTASAPAAAPAKPTSCPEHYKLDPWGDKCVKDN
jgi:serine/threonine-protein kinase